MNCPYVMKKCSKCGEILHISRFHKDKNGKYKTRPDCKECSRKYQKEYNKNNKEKISNRNKERYEKNKNNILKHQKEYNENNKEKISKRKNIWYEENKDDILKRSKERYEKNKDSILEKQKEYNKKWAKNNPEKIFNKSNKRRNKEENQGNGITKEQWYEMMNFFDWKCAYSGEKMESNKTTNGRTIDHIVALDNNGENEIWNCIPMKKGYNTSKHTKYMLEWYLKQPFFSIERLTKIYEWRIYAYWKWNGGNNESI